ncbi:MAG: hypothetical protein V4608_03250 [Bacteroidota bacterium]
MATEKSKTEKLQGMIGKSWKHTNDIVYKFLGFNESGEIITVATDKEWQQTTIYDLNVFIRQFTEVEVATNGEVAVIRKEIPTKMVQSIVVPGNTMERLRDTLLESIEKVKQDREYIPQAQSISNAVNSIVGLAKIEIDLRTKM